MGLMLARVGHTLSGTGAKTASAFALGAGASTGLVVMGQYGYGKDFATVQTSPEGMNHAVGLGLGAVGAAGTFGMWMNNSPAAKMLPMVGLGAGAMLGAYFISPTIRRAASEG